jgi:enterochelin esterase family protein
MRPFFAIALLFSVPLAALSQPDSNASPEVKADHSVTFHLLAPRAKEVAVRGQWDRQATPMQVDDKGVWSYTSAPIPAGVWEYSFVVDGLTMIDPSNPAIKPQRSPSSSILHIPGSPANAWDFQDVPHGTVHFHDYQSKALGRQREAWVYTPPGYETHPAMKYPLLVLQHGSGDNQQAWVQHGKAHWILDNLIASGKAKPMIILMIDGHPMGRYQKDAKADAKLTALDAFRRELFDDAIPLVEARYRVSPEREQRAITGLSMGGWQSLSIGLMNLDRFAWVGSFSGAVDLDYIKPALDDASNTNAKLKLLWIGVGKKDFLLDKNEALIAKLNAANIRHEWHLTEGDHSWPIWRNYLAEFAPKLFQ